MGNNNTTVTTMTKSSEQSFEQIYLSKDYKAAADYLLKNKQLFSSGNFHYNLGTIYSKMSEFPAARYHLEKAIQDGYVNSSSINNLNFVKSKLNVDDISTSTSFLDKTMNVATSIPFPAYSLFTLILCFIFLLIFRFNKKFSRFKFITLISVAFLPIAFYFIVVAHLHPAIAFKDISLQEGPSKIFAEKGSIKAGSKIIVGDFKDGWFFVKNPESLIGWVTKDQLGLY
jgi:hypothetical protein